MSPSRRALEAALPAAVVVLLAACGGGSSAGPAATSVPSSPVADKVRVTSSIRSGSVLDDATTWTAEVTSPGGSDFVGSVQFLVDGAVRWTEQNVPFQFDEGRSFAPWPLGAGSHTLEIRAAPGTPREATTTQTVTVRVDPKAHGLPVGSWHRVVTEADVRRVAPYRDAAHGAFGEVTPTGTWALTVRPDGVLSLSLADAPDDPTLEAYSTAGRRLTVYGPSAWLQPNPDKPSLFCEPEPPFGYLWSATRDALTVAATAPSCADRDQVLVGTWRRG